MNLKALTLDELKSHLDEVFKEISERMKPNVQSANADLVGPQPPKPENA